MVRILFLMILLFNFSFSMMELTTPLILAKQDDQEQHAVQSYKKQNNQEKHEVQIYERSKKKISKLKMHLLRDILLDLPFETKLKIFRYLKKINLNFHFYAILPVNAIETKQITFYWNLEFLKIIRFSEYTLDNNLGQIAYAEIKKIPIILWEDRLSTGYKRLRNYKCSIKSIDNQNILAFWNKIDSNIFEFCFAALEMPTDGVYDIFSYGKIFNFLNHDVDTILKISLKFKNMPQKCKCFQKFFYKIYNSLKCIGFGYFLWLIHCNLLPMDCQRGNDKEGESICCNCFKFALILIWWTVILPHLLTLPLHIISIPWVLFFKSTLSIWLTPMVYAWVYIITFPEILPLWEYYPKSLSYYSNFKIKDKNGGGWGFPFHLAKTNWKLVNQYFPHPDTLCFAIILIQIALGLGSWIPVEIYHYGEFLS